MEQEFEMVDTSLILAAIILFILNLIGLPGCLSAYDKFLIVVGLLFNVLTIY
jgi:hypothetical protein